MMRMMLASCFGRSRGRSITDLASMKPMEVAFASKKTSDAIN